MFSLFFFFVSLFLLFFFVLFCFVFVLFCSPLIQERAKVDAERKELEKLRALYNESKSHLDNCPESMREQLREQMRRVSVSPPPLLDHGPPPSAPA